MPILRSAAIAAFLVAGAVLTGCASQAVTAVPAIAPDASATAPTPTTVTSAPAPARTATATATATSSRAADSPAEGSTTESDNGTTARDSAPAFPAATPVCDGDRLDIRVERRPTASGAGQNYSEIVFTNTGDATCTLEGPPSMLGFLDPDTGDRLGVRGSDRASGEVVTLAPGQAG